MCYEKRICVIKLQEEYFYTAFVRKRGFLWRGRWKELTPTMQPSYDDAFMLTKRFDKKSSEELSKNNYTEKLKLEYKREKAKHLPPATCHHPDHGLIFSGYLQRCPGCGLSLYDIECIKSEKRLKELGY